MKKDIYESMEIEVSVFEGSDIIVTSTEEDETPFVPANS